MRRLSLSSIILVLALSFFTRTAEALLHIHGKEPLSSPAWSPGLERIVNHSARFWGATGPYGPTAQFRFRGGAKVLNEVLSLYGKIVQTNRTVYLLADSRMDEDDGSFELAINHDGSGYLRVFAGEMDLNQLKIPALVSVEFLAPCVTPLVPDLLKNQDTREERIRDYLLKRQKGSANPGTQ